jgi:hypothetical protein
MNKLDRSTEDWLERIAKASDPRKGLKRKIFILIILSIFVSLSSMLFLMFVAERPDALLVWMSFCYFFIMVWVVAVYFAIKGRHRKQKKYANETMAEGMVYSSKIVRNTDNADSDDIGSRPTEITRTYEILIAVIGLDKFLRAYVRVRVMEKGVYLQIPTWFKGDKVTVMYDSLKPKTCMIVTKNTSTAQANLKKR